MNREIAHRLKRLNFLAVMAFLLILLALSFWGGIQQNELGNRTDNPRLVEEALSVERGRIYDATGLLLAYSVAQEDGTFRRTYPLSHTATAVGYSTFRFGSVGIEGFYDDYLSGEQTFWDELSHRPRHGRDLRLTIDVRLQSFASQLLENYHGTMILLSIPDGAIKAIVSFPSYDPNALTENFDALVENTNAPLMNRATQAQYQPGSILSPLILAYLLDNQLVTQAEITAVNQLTNSVRIADKDFSCANIIDNPHPIKRFLRQQCPQPIITLAAVLSTEELHHIYAQYSLTERQFLNDDFPLALTNEAVPPIQDIRLSTLGQDSLTVTPLHVLVAYTALVNEGKPVSPYLVSAVQNTTNGWQFKPPPNNINQEDNLPLLITAQTANELALALTTEQNYIEVSSTALAGEQINTWYIGFTPIQNPSYALILLIEGSHSQRKVIGVGQRMLGHTLASDR